MGKIRPRHLIKCADCGIDFLSAVVNTKYCEDCRDTRSKIRRISREVSKPDKLCPFCGKDPTVRRLEYRADYKYKLVCSNRSCILNKIDRWYLSLDEARDAWNKRVPTR